VNKLGDHQYNMINIKYSVLVILSISPR